MADGPGPADSPAELTPGWMTAALRAGGLDVTVDAVTVDPIGHGQIGANYRLGLTLGGPDPGTAPRSLVAKMGAGEDRSVVKGGYRKELAFYLDLAATVAVRTPRCWYGVGNDDDTVFTLLLEDLAPAEPGDQVAGCTAAEAEAAVVNLAGLHGPRWCDPTLWDHPDFAPVGSDDAAFLAEVLRGATATFVERYAADLDASEVDLLHRFVEVVGDWIVARSDRFALSHGDYRLDNLLFAPDGRVSAVDWQTLSVALPGRDLAYLCATSLDPGNRRRHEEGLVAAYREALLDHGVDGDAYDEATAWEDHRLGVLQGPLITVLGAVYATAGRSDRADAMFMAMLHRSLAATADLDPFALL